MRQATLGEAEVEEAHWAQQCHVHKMEAVARLADGVSRELGPVVADANETIRELLAELQGTPEAPAYARLEEVRESLQRSAIVLRQLESVARVSRRPLSPVDLHGVIAKLRPLLPRLAGPFISVTERLRAPSSWVMIELGQLEQVLLTLVVNGRDAMPLGGTLTITTDRERFSTPRVHRHGEVPSGTWLTLSVHDTGGGMDESTLSSLFEPFFTTKPPGLGSGLGLAVLYGVVHQRGGHVIVETGPGDGTRVTVAFPDQPATEGATEGTALSPAVLVVDNDVWLRNVTARILRRAGYGVLEAEHGEAALELLRDVAGHCVGTVLSDIEMPRLDGHRLAELVRREHPELHVVLMSGDSASCDGEPTVLRKPFTESELLAAVHRSSVA